MGGESAQTLTPPCETQKASIGQPQHLFGVTERRYWPALEKGAISFPQNTPEVKTQPPSIL